MSILLTSVTGENVRSEVRAAEGHRITSFADSFQNQAPLHEWLSSILSDQKLEIDTHYICFPLQHVDYISRSDRSKWRSELGHDIRFYRWPYQPNHVIAYAAQSQLLDYPKKTTYQIPFLPIIYRELREGNHIQRKAHTAIFYIAHSQAALAICDQNRLLNQALIQFRSAADLLYFYLFSLKEFGIDQDQCILHLMGPKSCDESLLSLFDEQTNRSKKVFSSVTDAENIDLKLLRKCVL